MSETDRNANYTALQMLKAPKGAAYIWCNDTLLDVQELADDLDRTDLEILGRSELRSRQHCLRGRKFPAVILDPAIGLKKFERKNYQIMLRRCEPA